MFTASPGVSGWRCRQRKEPGASPTMGTDARASRDRGGLESEFVQNSTRNAQFNTGSNRILKSESRAPQERQVRGPAEAACMGIMQRGTVSIFIAYQT